MGHGPDTAKQKSPEPGNTPEIPRGTIKYEGVFLDNGEVDAMLQEIRGDAPYPNHSSHYHITTTAYLPEQDARALYGTGVQVRFIGYKARGITDDQKYASSNEGLKVLLASDDPAMAEYLGSLDKNLHLTGTYTVSPKYTESIDFSDMMPVDYTLRGVFGASVTGIGLVFDAADLTP